jgi:hypothetical protein
MDERTTAKELIATITAAHENLYKACQKFYTWVNDGEHRLKVAIDALVAAKYTEEEARKKIEKYLDWGSGRLDPRFFHLPAGVRERVSKFNSSLINDLFAFPMVEVVVHDTVEDKYLNKSVHFCALRGQEFDLAFTDTGHKRSPAKQIELAKGVIPKPDMRVEKSRIYFRAGWKTAGELNAGLCSLAEACTSASQLDKQLAEVTATLHKLAAMRETLLQEKSLRKKLDHAS